MATITLPSRTQRNTSVLESLRDAATSFIEGAQDGLDMARDYRLLSHMSEDELRKRGLTRAGVVRAVATRCARV
jgi:hypothetical protein